MKTLAFDVYGTLIDTTSVTQQLERMVGQHASAFSERWREKQLEYSFRRALMKQYENFSVCTRQALDYTDTYFQTQLSAHQKQQLLDSYRVLPAFPDVIPCLEQLKEKSSKMYAFSNGAASAVEKLLDTAGMKEFFTDIISTDEIQSFKPNPVVYQHLLKRTNSNAENTWLVSSNPFDVLGADAVGLKSAWLKRNLSSIFDPWEQEPTINIRNLSELYSKLS